MTYNWQLEDWPNFYFDKKIVSEKLQLFTEKVGKIKGLLEGLTEDTQLETVLQAMVAEAINTSSIEGEYLSRRDVLSSIKNNLGLHSTLEPIRDNRARGIGQMIAFIQSSYEQPLSINYLHKLHEMLMTGNTTINVGTWRSGAEPMRVISGTIGNETIHFEAPPSKQVPLEMERFIQWYNQVISFQKNITPDAPIRSALVHVYFESIHPYEDGNGRIGRALSEKTIYQCLGTPFPFSLSKAIETNKQAYYNALQKAQRSNEITEWVLYFVNTILHAQEQTEKEIIFTLQKTKFFDRLTNQLNIRQEKVLRKMLVEGPNSFEGGMNAKKYMSITKTSKATATRDLQKLVALGVFSPISGGRSTRYELIWD